MHTFLRCKNSFPCFFFCLIVNIISMFHLSWECSNVIGLKLWEWECHPQRFMLLALFLYSPLICLILLFCNHTQKQDSLVARLYKYLSYLLAKFEKNTMYATQRLKLLVTLRTHKVAYKSCWYVAYTTWNIFVCTLHETCEKKHLEQKSRKGGCSEKVIGSAALPHHLSLLISPFSCFSCYYKKVQERYNKNYWLPALLQPQLFDLVHLLNHTTKVVGGEINTHFKILALHC